MLRMTDGVEFWLKTTLFSLAGWVNREQLKVIDYLKDENRTLRKLIEKERIRLSVEDRRRLGVKGRAIGRKRLEEVATIACADTILGWFRDMVAKKWTYQRKSRGRPRTRAEVRDLIVKMAKENLSWGYTRVQGALKNLGLKISRGTIANVMKEHGLEGAPDRAKRMPWRSFLKAHWEVLAASDFLTTEVWTKGGLVTYYIFFVIELKSRRVEISGITPHPSGEFMAQVARNLTDYEEGFLKDIEILIRDRDKKYTEQFDQILSAYGLKALKLPARSPNLNAYAERFVLTLKSECLEKMIFFGEGSLRHALSEFMEHYHGERNHQSLGNGVIVPYEGMGEDQGRIQRKQRLGGMLNYYYRMAA